MIQNIDAQFFITTIAGNGVAGSTGDGGPATSAAINFPAAIWGDTKGALYISETESRKVRQVTIYGIIVTVAGSGNPSSTSGIGGNAIAMDLDGAYGVYGDTNGYLYISGYMYFLWRFDISPGTITRIAGAVPGSMDYGGDGGPATSAKMKYPLHVFQATDGQLYFADSANHRVRVVNSAGIITSIAGSGSPTFDGDGGPATASSLQTPQSVWGNTVGVLFVADSGNNRIRQISASGAIITTFAGDGGNSNYQNNVSPLSTSLFNPNDVKGDSIGNIYLIAGNECRVRVVLVSSNIITTMAGTGTCQTTSTTGVLLATSFNLNFIFGLYVDSIGNTFLAEHHGNYIRKVFYQPPPPSPLPTGQPSSQPSRQPTSQPTSQPICHPTVQPTSQPSKSPSTQPSSQPSRKPTPQPSSKPSRRPSSQPTSQPSTMPTAQPSARPSCIPSSKPSSQPSIHPSSRPSSQPTTSPSNIPSTQPSMMPTISPTTQPSDLPSSQPSSQPSLQPIALPTSQPSTSPSIKPSSKPSIGPSSQPSSHPTSSPSDVPSAYPSSSPSSQPSSQPSNIPTILPSISPTNQPSSKPTTPPSCRPSSQPSVQPSVQPSSQPTAQPTTQPSNQPTTPPSSHPSCQPSMQPSSQPSSKPTTNPSCQPSSQPSIQPSSKPSSQPTSQPSQQPSNQPSIQPSTDPSSQPSSSPTAQPFLLPSSQPSSQPTSSPSSKYTRSPTIRSPTVMPSISPTAFLATITRNTSSWKEVLSFIGVFSSPSSSFSSTSPQSALMRLDPSRTSDGSSHIIFGGKNIFAGNRNLVLSLSSPNPSSAVAKIAPSYLRDTVSRCAMVVGDMNGDGLNDATICTPLVGSCYLLFGDSNSGLRNVAVGVTIVSSSSSSSSSFSSDYFGFAMSPLGDMNGDGFADMVVSALTGRVCYVIYGRSRPAWMAWHRWKINDLVSSRPWGGYRIKGDVSSMSVVGISVAGLDDVNGDGKRDVAVSGMMSTRYVVYVIYGSGSANSGSDVLLSELIGHDVGGVRRGFMVFGEAGYYTGFSVSSGGDMNEDGMTELVIGAYSFPTSSVPSTGGKSIQVAYIIAGRENRTKNVDLGSDPISSYGVKVEGGGGFIVSSVGDVNGDGYDDVMVTSCVDFVGKSNAYIINYPSYMTSAPSFLPSSTPSSQPSSHPTTRPSTSVPTYHTVPTITEAPTPLTTTQPTIVNGTQAPVAAPTRYPTRTPTIRATSPPRTFNPSRSPTLRPSTSSTPTQLPTLSITRSRATLSPTLRSSHHPTPLPTSSPSPTPLPTTITNNGGGYSVRVVNGSSPGIIYGQKGVNEHFHISSLSENGVQRGGVSVTIYGRGGKKVYLFTPKDPLLPRNKIVIGDFDVREDKLDLSLMIGIRGVGDLAYVTHPLTFHTPDEQLIVLSSHIRQDLLEDNFIFSPDSSSSSSEQTSSGLSYVRNMMSSASFLVPIVLLVSGCGLVIVGVSFVEREADFEEYKEGEVSREGKIEESVGNIKENAGESVNIQVNEDSMDVVEDFLLSPGNTGRNDRGGGESDQDNVSSSDYSSVSLETAQLLNVLSSSSSSLSEGSDMDMLEEGDLFNEFTDLSLNFELFDLSHDV